MMMREFVVATHFFERGTALSFFGKVHKRHPKLLQTLWNVAFDLQISRMQELIMRTHMDQGHYLLPYFLTFDQGLSEVLDLYPLTACLFSEGGGYTPYTNFDMREFLASRVSNVEKVIGRFFTQEAYHYRESIRTERQNQREVLKAALERALSDM
jgi:hypothetical protein